MASKINVDKIARNSGTPEFTIPTADGTNGQAIVTNGSGVLSFADAGPSLTGSTNTWIPTITGANAMTGTANFTYDGNTLDIKNGGTASSINLYCETGNAHYIKLKSGPHASATSYTLTLPNAPPSTNGQSLTATTAGAASWTTVGGLSNASIWRLVADFTGDASPITNWEEADTDGAARVGAAMGHSSGIFTFPNTGIWEIIFVYQCRGSTSSLYQYCYIKTTTDNSSYNTATRVSQSTDGANADSNTVSHFIFDVTNTTTHKVRFDIDVNNAGTTTQGDTDHNVTHVIFKQLGTT